MYVYKVVTQIDISKFFFRASAKAAAGENLFFSRFGREDFFLGSHVVFFCIHSQFLQLYDFTFIL